jgi:hypothetical protein
MSPITGTTGSRNATPLGNHLTQGGVRGHVDGEFIEPHGVVIEGDGNVFVSDEGNQFVQKSGPVPVQIEESTWGPSRGPHAPAKPHGGLPPDAPGGAP